MAARERAYVRVAGPDACEHLQNMVSNDVDALQVGDACPALLLTAKARVIAPVVVLRRGVKLIRSGTSHALVLAQTPE